jgi:hypothetical protein
MICHNPRKDVIRLLWGQAIVEHIPSEPERWRQATTGEEVNPACLWLASDDFQDIIPLAKHFRRVDIPERDPSSRAEKREHLDKLLDYPHVHVLNGSLEEHLSYPGAKYMVINLDLTGHYSENTAKLVVMALARLHRLGLMFLTVSMNGYNPRTSQSHKRIANGPCGVISDLYQRIPRMDDTLLFLEGFPRSYYGNGKTLMHTFGWKKLQ